MEIYNDLYNEKILIDRLKVVYKYQNYTGTYFDISREYQFFKKNGRFSINVI
jgi:hypothetical protein